MGNFLVWYWTYITFKDNDCTEKYVKECLHRKEISLLAQIRFGILSLHIETGRFRSLNLDERICIICNSQHIEDEFHFIVSCNAYIEIRQVLYNFITSKIEEFTFMIEKNLFISWNMIGSLLVNILFLLGTSVIITKCHNLK